MTCQFCIICGKRFSNYPDWEIHWNEELSLMIEDGSNDRIGLSQGHFDCPSHAAGLPQGSSIGNLAFKGQICKKPKLETAPINPDATTRSFQNKICNDGRSTISMSGNDVAESENTFEVQEGIAPEKAFGRSLSNRSKGSSPSKANCNNGNNKGSCPLCNKLFPMHLLQQHVEQELDSLELAKQSLVLTPNLEANLTSSCSEPSLHRKRVQCPVAKYGFSWMKGTKEKSGSSSSSAVQGNGEPLQNIEQHLTASREHNQTRNLPQCFSWKGVKSELPKRKLAVKDSNRGSLLVLGDNPVPRERSTSSERKETLRFNHYADGGGWWDEVSVGIDCEALGSADIWEGMGSVSLGNLGQSM